MKNPDKYQGDITKITYRSLWERSMMLWLDQCPAVTKWASETAAVAYYDPVQNKERTYFIDFWVQIGDKELLIEVKPFRETEPPKSATRKTRKFITECATYETNQAKWSAARQMADMYGLKFEVWTEKHLTKLGILKEFQSGNKTMLRAERRAMPNSKYNPAVRARKTASKLRKTSTTPRRKS